jgi:adenosine deaminase
VAKIDLHRHVGGSISAETIHEILRKQCGESCPTQETIQKLITFDLKDKRDFQTFLGKFKVLDEIHWDEWAIDKAFSQICGDIQKEGLDHVELKFSIDKYLKHNVFLTPEDVVRLIHNVVKRESVGFSVALVLSLKYESDRQLQRNFARVVDSEAGDYLAGIDLVGDERFFDANFYMPIFKEWRAAGKGLQAHAGETQPACNVKDAIIKLNVQRVAHGIRSVDDPDVIIAARDYGVCFDIAITSNLFTGVVGEFEEHPVKRMLAEDCCITIGTDDPIILDTTLEKEYEMLQRMVPMTKQQLKSIKLNSARFAFENAI